MSIDLRPDTATAPRAPQIIPAADASAGPTGRRRRFQPGLILAVVFLGWRALAVAAPTLLSSTDPYSVDPAESFSPPSAAHWFGTDESGADVYSRIVHGARTSLYIGIGATAIGLVGGTLVGLLAGLGKRFVEASVMRFLDVTLAVPEILLALVVIGIIGGGTENAILAIGAGSIAYYARLEFTPGGVGSGQGDTHRARPVDSGGQARVPAPADRTEPPQTEGRRAGPAATAPHRSQGRRPRAVRRPPRPPAGRQGEGTRGTEQGIGFIP